MGKSRCDLFILGHNFNSNNSCVLKKITSSLLKELDVFARNGIKDELASLDPLLSVMGSGNRLVHEEGA